MKKMCHCIHRILLYGTIDVTDEEKAFLGGLKVWMNNVVKFQDEQERNEHLSRKKKKNNKNGMQQ